MPGPDRHQVPSRGSIIIIDSLINGGFCQGSSDVVAQNYLSKRALERAWCFQSMQPATSDHLLTVGKHWDSGMAVRATCSGARGDRMLLRGL